MHLPFTVTWSIPGRGNRISSESSRPALRSRSRDPGTVFSGSKVAGSWTWHSPLYTAEVKSECGNNFTPPYALLACIVRFVRPRIRKLPKRIRNMLLPLLYVVHFKVAPFRVYATVQRFCCCSMWILLIACRSVCSCSWFCGISWKRCPRNCDFIL